jgi:hypothetical protein
MSSALHLATPVRVVFCKWRFHVTNSCLIRVQQVVMACVRNGMACKYGMHAREAVTHSAAVAMTTTLL